MHTVYNPRSLHNKDPFGAVPLGKSAALTLRPYRSMGFSGGEIVARHEFSGVTRVYPLVWIGMEKNRDVFAGTIHAGDAPELVWYQFRFFRADGTMWHFGTGGWNESVSGEFQLTVYDEADAAPEWFGQGVTYQIFPDRFFREGTVTGGYAGERKLHGSWEEDPDYLPDDQGQIRNDDFFGGNIPGIIEKLEYLKDLSVDTIYLNPIFEAASNHRYDTGDYTKIDPMLGTTEQFSTLCREAGKRGIRLILDGVFSHTGRSSVYFNADGRYPSPGAANSKESPYFSWYRFERWPGEYSSWWGIAELPQVNEMEPSFISYILTDRDSVLRRWLRAGAAGWRLDVADELPDEFLEIMRKVTREEKSDAVLIGEVWENASNKISYGVRRKYLLGRELDGVTNYPFREALLSYLKGGRAEEFRDRMEELREQYPPSAFLSAMNILGNHDTPRILTVLGAAGDMGATTRVQRGTHRLSEDERRLGRKKVKLAALVMYAFPGSPTVYYGDEAGLQGLEDPMNRRTFPWGREDRELLDWFSALGRLRARRPSLQKGELEYRIARGPVLAFSRRSGLEETVVAVNAGSEEMKLLLPWQKETASDALGGGSFSARSGMVECALPPWSGILLTE